MSCTVWRFNQGGFHITLISFLSNEVRRRMTNERRRGPPLLKALWARALYQTGSQSKSPIPRTANDLFEITAEDIAHLNDEDLRSLVGRLCESEMRKRGISASCVTWGGDQRAGDAGIDVRVRVAHPTS